VDPGIPIYAETTGYQTLFKPIMSKNGQARHEIIPATMWRWASSNETFDGR
jgi:hypothetical protein